MIVKLVKDMFGCVDVIFLNVGLMLSSFVLVLKIGEWN